MTIPGGLAAVASGTRGTSDVRATSFIVGLAAFLMLVANQTFFSNVVAKYPLVGGNIPFVASVAWVFTGVLVTGFALVCVKHTIKPIAVALLLISSITAYFMDAYNTIIDASMLENAVNTDAAEVGDLLTLRLALYVLLIGIVPSIFVARMSIVLRPIWLELLARVKLVGLVLVSILLVAFPQSDHYASFLREHKSLRYYANPGCFVYAASKYMRARLESSSAELTRVGLDARVERAGSTRKLVVFVVGEAARADRFSLNGYERETNPLLATQDVASFSNFWSYGTSTATSLPYMFSVLPDDEYDHDGAAMTENVLDVMARAGVHVLWLDNNSSSKGVAERVPFNSCKRPRTNDVCDVECRDEGMLRHVETFVAEHAEGDLFVVLHQMGSHGPAYYKRYPADFERFTPVRRTSQLEECSDEELGNVYDNTILYTDYFLSKTIDLLRRNDDAFDVAMFYASDHGESLGENGLYLHGLPPFIAPDVQRHVATVVWTGEAFEGIDRGRLESALDQRFTHEHLSHSVLGMMDVSTSVYDPRLDLFRLGE